MVVDPLKSVMLGSGVGFVRVLDEQGFSSTSVGSM